MLKECTWRTEVSAVAHPHFAAPDSDFVDWDNVYKVRDGSLLHRDPINKPGRLLFRTQNTLQIQLVVLRHSN